MNALQRSRLLAVTLLFLACPAVLAESVDYLRDVKPLLARRCSSCHGPLKQRAGLRLDTVKRIHEGADNGPVVVPGKSADSLLLAAVTGKARVRMPPQGKPLTPREVDLVRAWIDAGAREPADEVEVNDPRQHWAYRPPTRPPVPAVVNAGWARNPIDAFVARGHERHGLRARPEAAKEVLLRRVYLDLIGLPPTREELHAFLADDSPDAYERVVDRLLASPRHGERWGRHWMDVWRYSDWYGRRAGGEIRYSQRHIWRWRDWIIESANADKGYDRMILEMLAGDELAPGNDEVVRATGFIGRNWYKFDRDVWLREAVEHTAMGFLALTLKCARCHDHKYDPIDQEDYYRFRAFFEPHEVRLDPLGEKDLNEDGLARIYDAKPDTPTYLFVNGDDRNPDKDNPLSPGVPPALGNKGLEIEPVVLPVEAYYPALRPENVEGLLLQTREAVAVAGAKSRQAGERLSKARAVGTDAEKEVPGKAWVHDTFAGPLPDFWKAAKGKWEYEEGALAQKEVTDWAMLLSLKEHPTDFKARVRYTTTPSTGFYHSVGLAFDVAELRDFQAVYTSAHGKTVQAFHRQGGSEAYPPEGIVPHPVALGREVTLDIAVRGPLLNVWADGELKLVHRMPLARRAGTFALWSHSGTATFHELRIEELRPEELLAARKGDKVGSPFASGDGASRARAIAQAEAAVRLEEKRADAARTELHALELRIAAERAKYAGKADARLPDLTTQASEAERRASLMQAELAVLEGKKDADKQLAAAQARVKQKDAKYTPLGTAYPQTSTGRRLALARWIACGDNPRTARVAVNHVWDEGDVYRPTVPVNNRKCQLT